jgi:hypothetical protein
MMVKGRRLMIALFVALAACAAAHALDPQSRAASPADAVRRYLSATSREEALGLLSPDYRLWFESRTGKGMPKDEVARMLEWDFALNPIHRVEKLEVDGHQVRVTAHEDNDFSLLIGFPGWDAASTFTVSEGGLITSQVYVPRKGQPAWKPYLEKALPWLREHHAGELEQIYPNNRLKQTAESAAQWGRLLRAWRAATGQPDPTRK